MKKISVAVTAFLAASSVYAAPLTVCTAPTAAGNGASITTAGDGFTPASGGAAGFVLNTFQPKCSANVYASIEQNEIALGVASGSKKGKNLFTGGTGGGGVKPLNAGGYPNGVASTDTDSNATTALAAAMASN